jgi:rubrerythrin
MSDSFKGSDRLTGAGTREALISQLKGLAISELAADDSYAAISSMTSDTRIQSVIEEIRKDEQNHLGRIVAEICRLEGAEYLHNLNNGLEGRE